MDPDDLEDALATYDLRVQDSGADEADQWVWRRHPKDAELILSTYRERIGEPLETCGLLAKGHEGWYLPKPLHDSPRWAHARKKLGLPEDVVERTSQVADQIVARLANPRAEEIATRGLVLGHVQSGKTTSYLSVAAKAVDHGYHLVIILAGVHNSLRRQTQDRAVRTLVHKRDQWWLGTAVGDFQSDGNSLGSHLAGKTKRGLLVVKKHADILRRLADWLEDESDHELRRRAVLVIDDEADQAGLDVSSSGELEGVHKQLRRIVDLAPSDGKRRVAYLAYTATPYANILTSQDDFGLYPRHFIYPLDKPAGYVGSQELFGDDQIGDPICLELDGRDDDLTEGLRESIRWFVLATAARVGLGKPLETFHSSMLIHTTQLTGTQIGYRSQVERVLLEMRDELVHDDADLEHFYVTTLKQVPSRPEGGDGFLSERTASWDEVRPHIREVLDRLIDRTPSGPEFVEDGRKQRAHSGVIVDNSSVDSVDRLTYSNIDNGQPSVTVIAIGGNTLSRGLTLEGLVCSYFARTARSYDTLMQMGRWFGYRPGYRHLLRVWTTPELFTWFRELNHVEQDLRDELIWMQETNKTPDVYGPRIRVSPNMNITRAAAMRSVSRHVSYSDTLIDPAWLDLRSEVISHNQQAVRSFAAQLGPWADADSHLVYRGVPLEGVRRFLAEFRFHEEERRVDMPSLERYLDTEAKALRHWNVVFKSVSTKNQPFEVGGPVGDVVPVIRAQKDGPSKGYINSVVDTSDHRADLGTEPAGGARYRGKGEPPLLTLYAIDPTSNPQRKGHRVALGLDTHPVSLAIALPESETNVDFVSPVVGTLNHRSVAADYEEHGDV